LGTLWLPIVAWAAGFFFFFAPFFAVLQGLAERTAQHLPPADDQMPPELFRWIGLLNILFLLVYAMIKVGVAKEALGLRKGPRFVYFWLGAAEFRVIGAYLILYSLMYISIIAILLSGAAVGAIVYAAVTGAIQSHIIPQAALGWMAEAAVVIGVVVALVWCYVAVRLSYLVVPVTVAEHRFGIYRSWELTKGNFWRIVFISVVVFIPILVVEMIAMISLMGPILAHIAMSAGKLPARGPAQFAPQMKNFPFYAAYGTAAAILFAPILYGLILSPSAFAYRALVPIPPEEGATPMMKEGAHP
jgi:hypothetical protein